MLAAVMLFVCLVTAALAGAGTDCRRRDLVDLGVGERAAVEQELAVADDADDRRLARRSGAASDSSIAQAKLGSSASGSAPPPTRATVSSTAPPTSDASRSARARTTAASSRSMRSTGIRSRRRRGRARSVPSSAASVSLSVRTARCSGCRRSYSTSSARPTTMPACGPPRSLSPEKQTRSAPAASDSRADGSLAMQLGEDAGAEIVEQRHAVPLRDGRELLEPRQLGEADDAEVRLVHAQEQGGVGAHRLLVVASARAVRRADLDEPRAGASEHVRDAEPVADLDQLAARDDHLATFGERGEREQHRGGVVVHDERGLGAGQAAEERGDVILARPAGARAEVELEVRVAARSLDDLRERLVCERRAAEVRVHDHAGRVQHAAQARRRARASSAGTRPQVAGIGAGADLLARPLEHARGSVDGERIVDAARELVDRRQVAQLHCASAYCAIGRRTVE